MKIKIFLSIACLFSLILCKNVFAAPTISESQSIEWAQRKGEEIIEILTSTNGKAKYEKLDNILKNDIDVEYIAKFSAGKYWPQMDVSQQQQYTSLFERYLAAMYKSFPLDIKKGEINFSIIKSLPVSNYRDIICKVSYTGLSNVQENAAAIDVNATFRLIKIGESIKVRDLKINESSLLIKLREHIYKLMREDDDEIDWFIDDFRTIVTDNEAKSY